MAQIDSEWAQLLSKSQPKEFPDAIVFDILSRLPVKSIFRFKSVSKKWYALSEKSQFIETHMNRSIETNDDCYLVAAFRQGDGFSFRSKDNFEEVRGLHFRIQPCSLYVPVGSTRGLVCIIEHDCNWRRVKSECRLLLWNPATGELGIFPKFPHVSEDQETTSYSNGVGFGFDPKKNDYKVVSIYPRENSIEVFIYSLKTDKWTKFFERKTNQMVDGSIAVDVNSRMHWLWRKRSGDALIFSFDVVEEKIIEMDLPQDRLSTYSRDALCESPTSLGKSLIYCQNSPGGKCQTWFMKDYGDSKSWTKLYHFDHHPVYGWVSPHTFLDNGDIVMNSGETFPGSNTCKNVLLYNPKSQVYEIISEHYLGVVKYKESLVSIKGTLLASG